MSFQGIRRTNMAQTQEIAPKSTSLTTLRGSAVPAEMRAGFDTAGGFELMQRGARLLASSTIVPAQYRNQVEKKVNGGVQLIDNPAGMSNCVVALNMAQRMGADPLMIMQNLYIVEGRPAWSSQYIIASINACGKYSPLRFTIEDLGEKDVEYTHIKWEGQYPNRRRVETTKKATVKNLRCIAWAIEKATGEKLESPPVTVELAVMEGWYGKEGSKWQTMPEVMLRYRAASFFGKLYAPELLMGIQTAEEVQDTTFTYEADATGTYHMTTEEIHTAAPEAQETEAAPQTVSQPEEKPIPQRRRTTPKPKPAAEEAPATAQHEPQQQGSFPAEPEYDEPGSDFFPPSAMTVPCPNRNNEPVDELDCASCRSRQNCPSWE